MTTVGGVQFEFDGCDCSIVTRAVMAGVDQLCVEADTSIDILDAIEYPLEEAFAALYEHEIVSVDVGVHGVELRMSVELRSMPPQEFGRSNDLVSAFFTVRTDVSPPRVSLLGTMT